jgi:hypothetical protein
MENIKKIDWAGVEKELRKILETNRKRRAKQQATSHKRQAASCDNLSQLT